MYHASYNDYRQTYIKTETETFFGDWGPFINDLKFHQTKQPIFSGIHAREWIAPATVTYILNELLTSTDPSVRDIAESYDWYVFPSVNPDGYEYTHTHVSRSIISIKRPSL